MSQDPKEQVGSDADARRISTPGKYPIGTVPGVFLHVTATARVWRFRYRLHGVGGLYTIGKFPDISHARACELGQEARSLVAEGIKPLTAKNERIAAQLEKEQWTFQRVTDLWLAFKSDKAAKTQAGYRSVLNNHILPRFGTTQVDRLQYIQLRDLILSLDQYPAVAKQAHNVVRSILDYAIDLGVLKDNIAARRINLVKRPKTVHHAAITTVDSLKEFISRLNDTNSSTVVSALWMALLLAPRPTELTHMRWEQIDFTKGEWRYHMTKTHKDHIVPLPAQAIGQLRLLQERQLGSQSAQLSTPFGRPSKLNVPTGWVFPSPQRAGRPIASISLLRQIRALGYSSEELTAHGFRATLRTIGGEVLGLDRVFTELHLGHAMPGPLGGTYDRAAYLDQRRATLQKWADYIEGLYFEVVNGVSRVDAAAALHIPTEKPRG